MKNKLLTLMLIVSSAFLMSCGKNSDNSSQVAIANGCGIAGHVPTTQGCLPQGTCPAGYGQSGNQCYAVTTTTGIVGGGTCQAGYVYTQYQCLPQSSSCPANYGYYNGSCYPATTTSTVGGGSCPVGSVGTARGCLPQNTCPVGYGYEYGYYNGQTGGWCYPQTY